MGQTEHDRLDRQMASVERTIQLIERGEPLMAEQTFDGFDLTGHREKVETRCAGYTPPGRMRRGGESTRAATRRRPSPGGSTTI
ncbi:MAG: hypothetical protein H7146_01015 [Burkholderiaceae bacterium]|nr:hypothetical protein [Microbacteriaceae bacterium]